MKPDSKLIGLLRTEKAEALAHHHSCENTHGGEFSDIPYPCRPTCECALRDELLRIAGEAE